MRAVFYWEAAGLSLDRANPYGGLLARAMANLGIEMVAGHTEELNENWLRQNQGRIDVLHLNWPHYMYDRPDLASALDRAASLVEHLALAHQLGYKIVWTVHNLYPHQSHHSPLDYLVRIAIVHLASAVIVHCNHARMLVEKHFQRRERVFVIPHGHFIDVYPNTIEREEARQQLGIRKEQFVYMFFGNVRPYKGLDQLLKTFLAFSNEHLLLLIAAKVYDEYGSRFVEDARQFAPRIQVHPSRFFANHELQLYFNAADVVVLPFQNVLTSGSVITALSFGQPVIVPAVGCLPELVDADVGVVYDPADPDGLRQAMQCIQTRDLTAARKMAYSKAASLGWDSIARMTLVAYQQERTI
jgi:beta-1,4-mannosyltransferase